MSKLTPVELDSLLDLLDSDTSAFPETTLAGDTATTDSADSLIEIVTLPSGEIDPRLRYLSHSGRLLLHTCPRKFQLAKLNSDTIAIDPIKAGETSVTFAYGHAVGTGIQSVLEDKPEGQCIIETALAWDTDPLAETPRQNKSLWTAIYAIQQFYTMYKQGYLEDFELVHYEGKPAVELSFKVSLPDSFYYRGFVDVVLRNKKTGEILVLELKTSSGAANPASYKNSGQAVGYSVVLDKMFPGISSYSVLYLVYETQTYKFVPMTFGKSLLQRALWLQELYVETRKLILYHELGTFPIHGESCYSWYRECEYLGLCQMDTAHLTKQLTTKVVEEVEKKEGKGAYMFEVSFSDLVSRQLEMADT